MDNWKTLQPVAPAEAGHVDVLTSQVGPVACYPGSLELSRPTGILTDIKTWTPSGHVGEASEVAYYTILKDERAPQRKFV